MKKTTYIIGHRNPDTDSICSAIALASLKTKLNKKVIAGRLGPLNDETKYILKKFNIENPLFIDDARSQILDIDIDKPNIINENVTIKDAWKMLLSNNMHGLCVENDNHEFVGFITSSNLSKLRLTHYREIESLMQTASLTDIACTIKAKIVLEPKNFFSNGAVYIMTLLEEQDYIEKVKDAICISSDNIDMQIKLIKAGAKCLVISCGKKPGDDVINLAKEYDCAIIMTDKDSMAIAQVINESFSIKHIMSTELEMFNINDYIDDVSKKMQNSRFRSYPVLDVEGKLHGTISRFHLFKHNKKRFILVDHSAKNQSIENISKAHIEAIVDHHHIGNIETDHPIYYRNEICGCTATIVASMYNENNIVPEKEMAAIMLGAIISDTLYFKSSTTTKKDVTVAKELAKIAELDIEEYAMEVLSASVSLVDSTPPVILNRDLKNYDIDGYKIAIGQSNYYNMEDLQTILPSFIEHFEAERKAKGYDLLVMMFTHVAGDGSQIVYSGNLSHIVEEVIETKISDNTGYDRHMISRKQQFLPKISELIKEL